MLMVRPGAAASFAVAVTNQDVAVCNGTTFARGYSGGAVAGSVSPASLTLAAGQRGSGALAVNSSLADGRYPLAVSATAALAPTQPAGLRRRAGGGPRRASRVGASKMPSSQAFI